MKNLLYQQSESRLVQIDEAVSISCSLHVVSACPVVSLSEKWEVMNPVVEVPDGGLELPGAARCRDPPLFCLCRLLDRGRVQYQGSRARIVE